ncbi:hypothetical protein LDFHOB_03365 [Candidatus Electronema aureum]
MTKKIVLFASLCLFALNLSAALAEPTGSDTCPSGCHVGGSGK